jgi:choice-of-anchor C domain-containing protein
VKRRSVFGTAIAMVAVLAVAGAALAASFGNGGFETGPATTSTLTAGSPAIDNWTVTGTDIDYVKYDGYIWQAQAGSASIDLNGFAGSGGLTQTFDTIVDQSYMVEFYMSGNPGTQAEFGGNASISDKQMIVSATGGASAIYNFDTAAKENTFADMKWELKAYTFKATSPTTTLAFASLIAGSFGPAIDSVKITEVIPTGTECKKDGWRTMRDSAGNAFRNQGDCVSFYATGEKNLANPKD